MLTRGRQPIAATAAAVQAHYQLRDEAHAQLLTEYADAAFQAKALSQQQTYFREQLQLVQLYLSISEPAKAAEAAAQALAQPHLRVVLPGQTRPALPPDPLADAPRG